MTDNPLVQLLRTYGPSAASDSQYDEHVREAVARHGVKELHIHTPLTNTIGDLLTGTSPPNVILTGTAGDGKTYLIRQFFLKYLRGNPTDWPGDDLVLSFSLRGGHQLRVIRDLSEFPDSTKAAEIEQINKCLTGQQQHTIYLIAANDGQLLEMWRVAANGSDNNSEHRIVHRKLRKMLHEDLENDPDGELNLKLFNLTHQHAAEGRNVVEEVVEGLLRHSEWESGCDGCQLTKEQRRCPIRINRNLLLGNGSPLRQVFSQRLQDIVELAAANDQHIPLRQIITLIVNILLGDHQDHDAPLLTCDTARERTRNKAYALTNPYNNAVGLNLTDDTRRRYGIFSVMNAMGIGAESTNHFDRLILLDEPADSAEYLETLDPVYGKRIFHDLRTRYINKPRSRTKLKTFPDALASQRRRLFFQLPETRPEIESPWLLTVFHNGDKYLAFKRAVSDSDASRSHHNKNVVDRQMYKIIRGFNRSLSGLMTFDDTTLWLASTVGKTDDPNGIVLRCPGVTYRSRMNTFYLREHYDTNRNLPCLEITSDILRHFNRLRMPISPFLFEYLVRVSEGYLPTSFSSQCRQELKHFSLFASELMVKHIISQGAGTEPRIETIDVLSLDSDASIKRQEMKVLSS